MNLKDKIKTTAKNIEGKVQEAVGEMMHNPETIAQGKMKQEEVEEQLCKNAEDHPDTEDIENKDEEVIEDFKTFEGNDKIEQFTSFEDSKNRSSK